MPGREQGRGARGRLSGVTAHRDELLAAAFEGAFLDVPNPVVDCV